MQPRFQRSLCRMLVALVLAFGLAAAVPPRVLAAASWPTTSVKGIATTWQLTLLQLRKLDRIPNTQWSGYGKHIFTFWVFTLRMTNTGHAATSIEDDLRLTLRVLPKYRAYLTPGWTTLARSSVADTITAGAAADFGGALPWAITNPGVTKVYCYVIGARPGEGHYGLYNQRPPTSEAFLFDTGY